MTTAAQALEARPTVEEVMRLADAVADAGSQMLPAVEIARRLATLRAALESTAAELSTLRAATASVQADQRAEVERLRAECEALRKDAEIGARWKADSSLEKWFPITAENMKTLEKDAARYRWLRDVSTPPHNFYLSVPIEFDGVRYTPHEVDAAIDAALSTSTAPIGAEE